MVEYHYIVYCVALYSLTMCNNEPLACTRKGRYGYMPKGNIMFDTCAFYITNLPSYRQTPQLRGNNHVTTIWTATFPGGQLSSGDPEAQSWSEQCGARDIQEVLASLARRGDMCPKLQKILISKGTCASWLIYGIFTTAYMYIYIDIKSIYTYIGYKSQI